MLMDEPNAHLLSTYYPFYCPTSWIFQAERQILGWYTRTGRYTLGCNGKGYWVLWLWVHRSAVVQPLMDCKGWGPLLKRQWLAIVRGFTLCRQKCQTYWWWYRWMTLINVCCLNAVWDKKNHKDHQGANICSINGLNGTQTYNINSIMMPH